MLTQSIADQLISHFRCAQPPPAFECLGGQRPAASIEVARRRLDEALLARLQPRARQAPGVL